MLKRIFDKTISAIIMVTATILLCLVSISSDVNAESSNKDVVSEIANCIVENHNGQKDGHFYVTMNDQNDFEYYITVREDIHTLIFHSNLELFSCQLEYDYYECKYKCGYWNYFDEKNIYNTIINMDPGILMDEYRLGDILSFKAKDITRYSSHYPGKQIQYNANISFLDSMYYWNYLLIEKTGKGLKDMGFSRFNEKGSVWADFSEEWDKYFKDKKFVNGVSVSPTSMELQIGDERTILANVYPTDADDKRVIWTSSDRSVATVAFIEKNEAKVEAIGTGTATITATTVDGGFIAQCNVMVENKSHYSAVREGEQKAKINNRNNPQSGWKKTKGVSKTTSFSSESFKAVDYYFRIEEMYIGDEASSIVLSENRFNDTPTPSQQWILLKIYLANNGDRKLSATDVINYSNFYSCDGVALASKAATLGKNYKSVSGVYIQPGTSGYYWIGVLIDKSAGFPYLMINNTYNDKTSTKNYVWLDTNPYTQCIEMENDTVSINQDEAFQLTVVVDPNDDSNGITWDSSNPQIVSVNNQGIIKGNSGGTAIISARIGKYEAQCVVTVKPKPVPVTSIRIQKKAEVEVGDSIILVEEIEPYNATNKSVTWISDDASVAFVSDWGTVYGIKPGVAKITVTTSDGKKTDNCIVYVKENSGSSITPTPKPQPAVTVKSISNATVTGVTDKTYTGKALTQNPTVKVGGTTLKNGTDYSLSYINNVNVGTATMTITGKGSYKGSKKVTFNIKAAVVPNDLKYATVTGVTDKTYTGKAITQNITVKLGSITLKNKKDYTITYKNNKKVGTASITLKGKGKIKGTRTIYFKIKKGVNPLSVKGLSPSLKAANLKKKNQTLAVTKVIKITKKGQGKITYAKASGDKRITIDKKGKVTVKKGTPKGNYTVKVNVTAAGNSNYNQITKPATFTVKVA